jgi:two-component system, OmpR family, sensor histidine kinase KdpD
MVRLAEWALRFGASTLLSVCAPETPVGISSLHEPRGESMGEIHDLDAIEHFLETIAHEVRTPLSIAKMAAGSLATRQLPELERDRLLSMVVRNADLALMLVDRISLARDVATETVRVDRQAVDVARLVTETVGDLREVLRGSHPIDVVSDHALVVDADATALREILFNLLLNAAKYSPDGAPISVRVEAVGDDRVAVSVGDRGDGICPADRERIFGMYVQGDGTVGGVGLGLFISRGLARAHGGELEARPGEGGGGSEFVLHLPRTAPRPDIVDQVRPAATSA